jgi:hypothetical protein
MGPDDAGVRADQGARMVANIAAVHAITFCDSATKGDLKPYKNCYDLRKHCVGDGSRRVLVDESLPVHDYTNTYIFARQNSMEAGFAIMVISALSCGLQTQTAIP